MKIYSCSKYSYQFDHHQPYLFYLNIKFLNCLMGNTLCANDRQPLEFPEAEINALGFRKLSEPVTRILQEKKPFESKISKSWTTIEFDGDVYQGKLDKNNKPDGYGRVYKKDGSYYIGQFEKGKADGEGFYITNQGEYYEGKFVNNFAKDKSAKYVSRDIVYEGGFENNKFQGQGVEKGPNYTFKGTFQNGFRKKGTLIWKETVDDDQKEFKYEGQFVNNQFQGDGELRDPYGVYKGSFKQGQKDGKGRYQYVTGMSYVGDYVMGYKQGKGSIFNDDGRLAYEGEMENGLPNGHGTMYNEKKEAIKSQFLDGVQACYISKLDQKKIRQSQAETSKLRANSPLKNGNHKRRDSSEL